MNYIETVNDRRGKTNDKTVIPPEVFAHALSLKQPDALARRPTPDSLMELPVIARRFEKARTVGNASVKLALASYLAAKRSGLVVSLYDSEPHVQEEILMRLGGRQDAVDFDDDEVRRRLFATKRAMHSGMDRLKAFGSYVNFRTDSYHPDATGFGENDALLVQAFGRNMFEDKDMMTEVVEKRRDLGSDEAMFAHLKSIGFDEGESNRALADVAAKNLKDPYTSIEQVWQWEVSYSVWNQYPEVFENYRAGIHTLWPKSNFYPTYDVKADSLAVMRERGLYNPLELAHPDMTIRAMGILGKLGVAADPLPAKIPFDPESTQDQTKNPHEWVKRESLTRVHHVITNHVRF